MICFFTSQKDRLDHLFLRGGNMSTWFKIQVIQKDLQGKIFASLTPICPILLPEATVVVLNFLSILQIYICICWPVCVYIYSLSSLPHLWTFLIFSFYLFVHIWPRHTGCWILVPQPGIKAMPPTLEAQSLNYWTTREIPHLWPF